MAGIVRRNVGVRIYHSFESDDRHQPMMWLKGRAVYAAHLIVIVFAASMLLTTLMAALQVRPFFAWLPFTSDDVLRGQVWRIVTYGLVNRPSLWFVVDLAMIVWFGRELEKFFGRRIFLVLFASVYALTPLIFTLIGRWMPATLAGESGAFALFVAFATLYPNAEFFLGIAAKWLAAILVGIYLLIAIANRDVLGLLSLGATVAFAHAFVRFQQGRLTLPAFPRWRRSGRIRGASPGPKARNDSAADDTMASVDALLDKIARSGFASLTPKERARLDQARSDLLRRNSAGRS